MFKWLWNEIIYAIKLFFSPLSYIYQWIENHTTTFIQCVCLKCGDEYTRIQGNIKNDGTTFYCPQCKRVKHFSEVL